MMNQKSAFLLLAIFPLLFYTVNLNALSLYERHQHLSNKKKERLISKYEAINKSTSEELENFPSPNPEAFAGCPCKKKDLSLS